MSGTSAYEYKRSIRQRRILAKGKERRPEVLLLGVTLRQSMQVCLYQSLHDVYPKRAQSSEIVWVWSEHASKGSRIRKGKREGCRKSKYFMAEIFLLGATLRQSTQVGLHPSFHEGGSEK